MKSFVESDRSARGKHAIGSQSPASNRTYTMSGREHVGQSTSVGTVGFVGIVIIFDLWDPYCVYIRAFFFSQCPTKTIKKNTLHEPTWISLWSILKNQDLEATNSSVVSNESGIYSVLQAFINFAWDSSCSSCELYGISDRAEAQPVTHSVH